MGRRLVAVLLGCLVSLVVATDASAHSRLGGLSAVFSAQGSNDFRISVEGSNGLARIFVVQGHPGSQSFAEDVYTVPATTSKTGLNAKLGALGSISMQFRPSGRKSFRTYATALLLCCTCWRKDERRSDYEDLSQPSGQQRTFRLIRTFSVQPLHHHHHFSVTQAFNDRSKQFIRLCRGTSPSLFQGNRKCPSPVPALQPLISVNLIRHWETWVLY
jgi:hypothetical protein